MSEDKVFSTRVGVDKNGFPLSPPAFGDDTNVAPQPKKTKKVVDIEPTNFEFGCEDEVAPQPSKESVFVSMAKKTKKTIDVKIDVDLIPKELFDQIQNLDVNEEKVVEELAQINPNNLVKNIVAAISDYYHQPRQENK